MKLSFNPENKPKDKLRIMLMHQTEFLTEFLFNSFTDQNKSLIKKGVFNSREDFKIKKEDLRKFISERGFKSSQPKLLSGQFYFLNDKSVIKSFDKSADEKGGFNSQFYNLLDEEIVFKQLLKEKIEESVLKNSILAPILSINKCLDELEYLIFDRDKINSIFSDIFQVNFNSPKEDIENKAKSYFINAKNFKHIAISNFINEYKLKKESVNIDTIEKICSTNDEIHTKLLLDKGLIQDDVELFNSYITKILNDFKYFKNIYEDFRILYEQSSAFLNIIQSNLDDFKQEGLGFTKKEAQNFYKKSSKEIGYLKKIFNVQNFIKNGRSTDEERLNIVSYQAKRVIDFLEEIIEEIDSIKSLQNTTKDLKSFVYDITIQVELNREFYKKIIEKNNGLIELIKSANAEVERKIITEDFFKNNKHLMDTKNINKIERTMLDKIIKDLNVLILPNGEHAKKTTTLKIYTDKDISFEDVALEYDKLKNFKPIKILSEEEINKKRKEEKEKREEREKMVKELEKIEKKIGQIMEKTFEFFEYSEKTGLYCIGDTNNNKKLGDLYTEPYLYLKNNREFKEIITKSSKEYISILSSLHNKTYEDEKLLDFSKHFLDLNIIANLEKPEAMKGKIL